MKWPQPAIGVCCLETEQVDPRQQQGREFLYVDIASVDRTTKAIVDAKWIAWSSAPSRARKIIRTNDVLVSTVRPNLNAVALVSEEYDGQIASTGFCVLRAKPDMLMSRYLFYRTQHPAFVADLCAQMRGANYPAVSDGVVKESVIPLPVPAEQRRIVELLDQADALRKRRAEADALADRILPALFLKMFGDPATNPKGLPTKPIREVSRIVGGGTPSRGEAAFWTGGIPWVSPKDMKAVRLYDTIEHVSGVGIDNSTTTLVPEGTLLIVFRSGILAHSVPLAITMRPMALNQDMKALVVEREIHDPYYLLAWMFTARQQILGCVKTGATVQSIDANRFSSLGVYLPDPDSQRFAGKAFRDLLDMQDKRWSAGLEVDSLFSTMLSRAFAGNLTARWREAHMKELLQEMEQQARRLSSLKAKEVEA
jgi:type I restriction enzyme S subunit